MQLDSSNKYYYSKEHYLHVFNVDFYIIKLNVITTLVLTRALKGVVLVTMA